MEKEYTYEITKDGYYIFIDGKKVIHQYEPYIPNKELSYEENAKAQIEEMKKMDDVQTQDEKTGMEQMQEQITELQLAMAELIESKEV